MREHIALSNSASPGARRVSWDANAPAGQPDRINEEDDSDDGEVPRSFLVEGKPKADKGKGRAEPEPEPVESVLSTTFLITESDDEDGEGPVVPAESAESLVSPTDLCVTTVPVLG